MEEKIISVLGKNHTKAIELLGVNRNKDVYGLYTFQGDVYCFKECTDIPFDCLTEQEQKTVVKHFESKKWKINAALQ